MAAHSIRNGQSYQGEKPDLTAEGVKQVIIDTADPLPSLQDKTITGARANLRSPEIPERY